MTWFQRLIHRLLPSDRHHALANKVQIRELRLRTLQQRVQVIERRGEPR